MICTSIEEPGLGWIGAKVCRNLVEGAVPPIGGLQSTHAHFLLLLDMLW